MKKWIYLISVLFSFSCAKKTKQPSGIDYQIQYEKESEKVYDDYLKFEKELQRLYSESENNPTDVLVKTDNLLKQNSKKRAQYRPENKSRISEDLNYLKAEMHYKLNQYEKSLEILLNKDRHTYGFIMGDDALAIAANYTKLKEHDKAKSFVDSIRKGYYIYDYALGNYYESIGDKTNALKVYEKIKADKNIKHYAYYPLAVERLQELQKNNPKLLNELYFPTGNPSFEICDSDDENRGKIFRMIQDIPECKGYGVHIYQSPQTNDKDYYWIKISNIHLNHENIDKDYKAKYDFFIYPKDFSIKYYEPETMALLSIEEWRASLKK